jgi:hypothetical protein
MRKNHVLTSVSAIALATGAMMGGARADSVVNVTIDWVAQTVSVDSSSISASIIQTDNVVDIVPTTAALTFGLPVAGTHDYDDGLVALTNSKNKAVSTGIINSGLNSISLWLADGAATKNAATSSSLQISDGGTQVDSLVDTSVVRVDSLDLAAGSSQRVEDNLFRATATGNLVTNEVVGDVNPGLSSTEAGQALLALGSTTNTRTSATVLATAVQLNEALGDSTAIVTDSRIGSLATVTGVAVPGDSTDTIDGITLTVTGNAMEADFAGNDSTNQVIIDDAYFADANVSATTFTGSMGAANEQRNTNSKFLAEVTSSVIEAGDTTGAPTPIDNLTGTTLTFQENSLDAAAVANTTVNTARITGINVDGPFPSGTQTIVLEQTALVNVGSGNDGHTQVAGDIFVANHQYSTAEVTARIGNAAVDKATADGDLNVLVENLKDSASVVVGDTDLSDDVDLGNSISSSATGNAATNTIVVEGATTVNALIGLGNGQMLYGPIKAAQTGNDQFATTNGDLTVSVATLGGLTGDIVASSLLVDGNSLSSAVTGNQASNTIDIDAGTYQGPNVDPLNDFMRADHAKTAPRSAADISLTSGQLFQNGDLAASTIGSIIVDAADVTGAAGSEITDSSVSVDGNRITAEAVANHVGKNFVTADTTTFEGTVGVINYQVAEESKGPVTGFKISASIVPSDDDLIGEALVDLDATAASITDSTIGADGNIISALVFGNLVDAETNGLSITGVTVGDGVDVTLQKSTPVVTVERFPPFVVPGSDGLPITIVQGGFAVLNDQSVEDLDKNAATATITGNFVDVLAGSVTSTIARADVTASDNQVTGAVTLNQGNSSLTVDAQTLDATSSLVNVQTLWREATTVSDTAGAINVELAGDITNTVRAGVAGITESTLQVNGNDVLASGRISNATNTVSITAQTQVVTDLIGGADINQVQLGPYSSLLRAENGLLNDQDFDALQHQVKAGLTLGVDVDLIDTDALLIVSTDQGGDLVNSTAEADGNTFTALALGNDAKSTMTLDVGSFDISGADSAGPQDANGPLGVIASSQRASPNIFAVTGVGGPFQANTDDVDIIVDADGVGGAIERSKLSTDGNDIYTLARVNNAVNTLNVSGNNYEEEVSATPAVRVLDVDGATGLVEVAADDLAFGIANFQLNNYDVVSGIDGSDVSVLIGGAPTVDSSSLSSSGNDLIAEARGNEAVNSAGIAGLKDDLTTNHASAFVVNAQVTGPEGISIQALVDDVTIEVDGGAATDQDITDSSFEVIGNDVLALASSHRAANALTASGNNVYSGSGGTAPLSTIDPTSTTGDIVVNADLSVVNAQGTETVVAGNATETIKATVTDVGFEVDIDDLISGSVRIDNNVALGQGVIHSASNTLIIDAAANVGADDDQVSGAVVSQQIISQGSSVDVILDNVLALATISELSDSASAAVSASGNKVLGEGVGASAVNVAVVSAGASILGGVGAAAPQIGDLTAGNPIQLDADFSVLNLQIGEPDVATTIIGTAVDIEVDSQVDFDSLEVDDNVVQASSVGFNARNILVLDAGSSSDATGQVGNRQAIGNAAISTLVGDTALTVFANDPVVATGGALDSAVSVSDNEVNALSNGNVALNAISSTAGATLQEEAGAGTVIDPAAGLPVTVTGAEYAVLNMQTIDASTVTSTIGTTDVGIDGFSGDVGVDRSAFQVEGNVLNAQAIGNSAINSLVLSTGTFQHPSAAVASLQTASGTDVTATVTDVSVGIGLGGGLISGTSSNSSFTVRGNAVGATAIGNSAVNIIRSGD